MNRFFSNFLKLAFRWLIFRFASPVTPRKAAGATAQPRVRSELFAAAAQIREHRIDAFLIDDPHAFRRDPQTYEALLAFHPETMMMQVRQKPTTRAVVCVADIISRDRALSGDLADLRHDGWLWLKKKERVYTPRFTAAQPRPCPSLRQYSVLRKTEIFFSGHDDVVNHANLDLIEQRGQPFRQAEIACARLTNP